MTPRRRSLFGLVPALWLLASCQDPVDPRLFDETGTWSLQKYALDGLEWHDVDQSRNNAFLLKFDGDMEGVVAAATCEAGGSASVDASTCQSFDEDQRIWHCRCFSYVYKEKQKMQWQEFAPGSMPPPVMEETGEGGETGGIDTAADPSDSIGIDEDPVVSDAYVFSPLPGTTEVYMDMGLFNSDGVESRHLFLRRSDGLFEESMCAATCGL